ncbi:unnamed protein product [Gongylonema pulchrum]|uniref:Tex_N domain-containing protein n=1 Tax=Gongylonema pulchrum TaxID=637853 RepID=A0A183DST4_9BILA|nr:unnamed protein product [Gongylonema pulchrum]
MAVMDERMQIGFRKASSRYMFNLARICAKYCGPSADRRIALRALQRNLGEAHISSPVLYLPNERDRAACQRLNELFEAEYTERSSKSLRKRPARARRSCDMEQQLSKFTTSKMQRSCTTVVTHGYNLRSSSRSSRFVDGMHSFSAWDFLFCASSKVMHKSLKVESAWTFGVVIPCDVEEARNTSYFNSLSEKGALAGILVDSVEEGPLRPETSDYLGCNDENSLKIRNEENLAPNVDSKIAGMLTVMPCEEGPSSDICRVRLDKRRRPLKRLCDNQLKAVNSNEIEGMLTRMPFEGPCSSKYQEGRFTKAALEKKQLKSIKKVIWKNGFESQLVTGMRFSVDLIAAFDVVVPRQIVVIPSAQSVTLLWINQFYGIYCCTEEASLLILRGGRGVERDVRKKEKGFKMDVACSHLHGILQSTLICLLFTRAFCLFDPKYVLHKVEEYVQDYSCGIFAIGFPLHICRSLAQLFEDGCEVPFVARYRRHLIGGATPDDLRHALVAFNNAKALRVKAEKLIKRADAEIGDRLLRDSVKNALSKTMDEGELDGIFEPFKKARKGSLATRAAELGLTEVCEKLRRGEFVNLQRLVGTKPGTDFYYLFFFPIELPHFFALLFEIVPK